MLLINKEENYEYAGQKRSIQRDAKPDANHHQYTNANTHQNSNNHAHEYSYHNADHYGHAHEHRWREVQHPLCDHEPVTRRLRCHIHHHQYQHERHQWLEFAILVRQRADDYPTLERNIHAKR